MKNTVKWIVTVVLLAGVIAGATLLYNNLSKSYAPDKLVVNTTAAESEDEGSNAYSAPDFTVLDYDGNEVELSDYRGKPVVLNFWATWCKYCVEEMPDFDKAQKNYPDVQFLMVNATDGVRETVAMAKKYVEESGFEFKVLFDTEGEAVRNYFLSGFPATFFIDKNGNLVTYANGMLDYKSLVHGVEMITED